ncbi:glycoside hydrolase family 113 [Streptomyces sp. NPDC051018]|uniref:glycoside hydrolase family 113 n=1 Tax=Streptomyces sp. NPDC051018 TaxID=3365639 RepID=UPI00379F1353
MKRSRSRLPLLAVFPLSILLVVVATPLVLGDHPVRWESGSALPEIVWREDEERPATDVPGTVPGDTAGKPDATAPAAPPVDRVAKKWKPGMPQWGVQIYWEENPKHSDRFIEGQARKHARYLVGLGANSVSVSFPFYTGGKTSTRITDGPKTPSPQRLERVLTVFQEAGLRTTVRPLMDEKSLDPPEGWRGNIEPSSRTAWFTSYRKFLTPYLEVAERRKATTFVVGTELNSMEGAAGWSGLVAAAEKIYSGEISYDANWDSYVRGRIDMPVKHLGVDAYFPVKVPDSASVDTLVDGWDTWLDKKAAGPLPKIVIAEAGIGAMNGAYHAPGDFYNKRRLNPAVQATWYTAVCRVVEERRMAGVYWWSIYFEDDPFTAPDDRTASRLDFAGRPKSEKAIKDCFTSDYRGPGSTAATP